MRRIVVMLAVAAVMALSLLVSAMPAFAAASSQASCAGTGNSTETALEGPGAVAERRHEVKAEADEPGTTVGDELSFFSQEHLGSIDACFGDNSPSPHSGG
jgi:hypothetical protein